MEFDLIVLGAGPAGLGAALAAVRSGARVALVEASPHVGGLSVTMRRGEAAFDLGGHILFVHDGGREAWLRELLGRALVWVDRPVVAHDDDGVSPGRYLDRRSVGIAAPPLIAVSDSSAATMLNGLFGPEVVDRHMRPYLEKVDGMPLETITATRARKLLVEQYAPDGFWFADGGVGRLMDEMARGVRAGGGVIMTDTRAQAIVTEHDGVRGVRVVGTDGVERMLTSPTVVGAIPPMLAARLVQPPMPEDLYVDLPPRAAAIVALSVATEHVSEHAWIQIAHPDVPFARLAEMKNWSRAMSPADATVLVCEVYCHPTDDDPWWSMDDAALAAACATALQGPLDLVGRATRVTPIDVVRIPRAWSLVDVASADAATGPARWLAELDGFVGAQGGDVISAIAAGEHAAALARTALH